MPPVRVTPNRDPRPDPGDLRETPSGIDRFVFAVCQVGAENAIKSRLLNDKSPLRLAFSRPGLLTFKVSQEALAEQSELAADGLQLPNDWLIRLSGHALGQLRGERAEEMAQQVVDLAGSEWDAVHVFARDSAIPGERGFEPGPTPMTEAVRSVFQPLFPAADVSGGSCELGSKVLDIMLVDTNHWLVGWHHATEIHECWPGGSFPVVPPPLMISRAYLKMAEAVAWSQFPFQSGDAIVEIGSSPGGASQRLLDLGLKVTGVDPAEMDELLLKHPRFEHWRNKSSAIKRKRFSKFKWLAADANVAPNYTLDAVQDIVQYPSNHFEGLLLTFKLSSYAVGDSMQTYLDRVRGWGFEHVKVRQLASNRRECCVAARR